jgi:3-hydroxymyristoyl/3-hydroxydecanoyl-(acyl carrier protein) dehydratase
MPPESLAAFLKTLRRQPLSPEGGASVHYEDAALQALLPHRPPFLLIDAVDAVDLERRTIRGRRQLRHDDPVFKGHFPDYPVYPGVLQIEAMGQLAMCLAGLMSGAASPPPRIVMTKVLDAMFIAPLMPGDDLVIHGTVVEDDGLIAVTAGQIYKDGQLAALAVQEGCYVG